MSRMVGYRPGGRCPQCGSTDIDRWDSGDMVGESCPKCRIEWFAGTDPDPVLAALETIDGRLRNLRDALGAGVVRLPATMREQMGTNGVSMKHAQVLPAGPWDGFVWSTYIGPESIYLRVSTQSGMTLQEWRSIIEWVPDIDFPGTAAWHRARGAGRR